MGLHTSGGHHDLFDNTFLTSAERTVIKQHLQSALEGEKEVSAAHALLGQVLWQEGEEEGSIDHLKKAALTHPDSALTLASLYTKRGNDSERLQWAATARKGFANRRISAEPGTPPYTESTLKHIESLAYAKRFADASRELRDLGPTRDQRARAISGRVNALWAHEGLAARF